MVGQQNLTSNFRIALSRFKSRKPKLILRVIRDIEIDVRLANIQHPQCFCGDGRIRRQRTTRHELKERYRIWIASPRDIGSRNVAITQDDGIIELHPVEADFRVLCIVKPLLRLELLLDIGVSEIGRDEVCWLLVGTKRTATVVLFESRILDGPVHVHRSGIQDASDCATTGNATVGRVGIVVPRRRRVVVKRFRQAVDVFGVVRVLSIQESRDIDERAHRHIGVGRSGLDEPESRIVALVDNLNVFLGQGDVDFLELDIELELLFDLRLRDIEVLPLGVRTTDQTGVVASCCSDDLANPSGRGYFYHVLMVIIPMRSDYRTTLSIPCRGLFA